MRIAEQAQQWLADSVSRKKNPIAHGTFVAYRSYLDKHIIPMLGDLDLSKFGNKQMRAFVSDLAGKGLSASTITGLVCVAKEIKASVITEDGDEVYPIKWNDEFCDIPQVKLTDQDAPVIDPAGLKDAMTKAPSGYAPFFSLLAGSGLRIGEAKALKLGDCPDSNPWLPERSLLVIRGQIGRHGRFIRPKTDAGVREVDLPSVLNDYLKEALGRTTGEWMFTSKRGECLNNVNYNELKVIGMPGCHSLRRFRITHLENMGVPDNLSYFWTGHAKKDVHDRYVKHTMASRRDWAERAGLGFELP